MRKKFVQIAALALILSLLPAPLAGAVPEEGGEPVIRVGLYYGSTALHGANLANSVGSGFTFGYYDSELQFVPLGETDHTAVSMVKTANVYYGRHNGYNSYHESLTDSPVAVGCYHLQLPEVYSSFSDARRAADQVEGGFVAYIDGDYYVRLGGYLDKEGAEEAQASLSVVTEIKGTSAYGVSVVETGTSNLLFQYDDKGNGTGLGVEPIPQDEENCVTLFKNLSWYGGFRYERVNGGDLTVVNLVPLEDYIKGVIPHEMSPSWPLEALKAQAVCARSYTLTNLNKHRSYHFDLCNTTDCQVYYGTGSANETTDQAVDETMGEFAWYDGELIEAYYHASDGGATENSENVWREVLPYLRGVEDPFEGLVEDRIPGYHWTVTYTGKELTARLNSQNYPCDEIVDLRVSEYTDTGNVYSVSFTDVNGTTWTISKDDVRIELGLKSLRFTITGSGEEYFLTDGQSLGGLQGAWILDGDEDLTRLRGGNFYAITGDGVESVSAPVGNSSDGAFVIRGTGHGHNLGMSQWGAHAMALEGYTYKDILTFYFTGIEIE